MKRLERAVQYAMPALQQFKRDLTDCLPLSTPTQRWMCPNCDRIHDDCPVDMDEYRCICAWHGNRSELLTCTGEVGDTPFKQARTPY